LDLNFVIFVALRGEQEVTTFEEIIHAV